jgi:UPF0755 protein
MLVLAACGSNDVSAPAKVVVPRGATVRAVADSLESAGVVGSARLFRWYASVAGRDRAIKAGTYQINTGESWGNVLDALVSGKAQERTLTIPEGFDLRDITPALAKTLEVPVDSVRAAVADTALIARLQIPVGSLEGYLFPDTYTFPDGTTARAAINAMVERFLEVWKPEWDARLQAMAISRHDAITMASIVEKEARVAAERPIIAAVYWNRLKAPMRLQADPTVQYALPEHVERVMYKDLEVDSKYNTYRNDGLPPGPIASPGEASIDAALNPAPVSYLFFVAHPDGHHEFRNTFAEHQKAIAMVRKGVVPPKPTADQRRPAARPK